MLTCTSSTFDWEAEAGLAAEIRIAKIMILLKWLGLVDLRFTSALIWLSMVRKTAVRRAIMRRVMQYRLMSSKSAPLRVGLTIVSHRFSLVVLCFSGGIVRKG